MSHLPGWIHRVNVRVMWFVEVIVPFFYFAGGTLRFIAAILTILLMVHSFPCST
jgi:hypothetical protein